MKKTASVTSVTNLKASLSAFLDSVKSGEEVLVTERGRPIARLIPYSTSLDQNESTLRLIRAGVLRPAREQSIKAFLSSSRLAQSQASVVEALLEDREEGF
ncbi:type II toxin-antitoxin system prevent-host-death family antitoxin [bacterium]|nr:type II toxin-antitoxin system prevent-host-death family antitoxin [bacterium]